MDAPTVMISRRHRSAMDVNSHGNFVGRAAIYDWHKNLRDDSVCTGVRMYRHWTPLILQESTDEQFDIRLRYVGHFGFAQLSPTGTEPNVRKFKRGAEAEALRLTFFLLTSPHASTALHFLRTYHTTKFRPSTTNYSPTSTACVLLFPLLKRCTNVECTDSYST
ncbi:hypothetical protein BDD12DRAFT_244060 [Trichophaea hybrida]|nr:hypothetical protein BDD12DRAFT_244060 [Trichophaea hybrida]